MLLLQEAMHFTEEIIEKKGGRLTTLSHLHYLITVVLDYVEDFRGQRVISKVGIIHALPISVLITLASRCGTIVLSLYFFGDKFRLLLAEDHKTAFIGRLRDPIGPLDVIPRLF